MFGHNFFEPRLVRATPCWAASTPWKTPPHGHPSAGARARRARRVTFSMGGVSRSTRGAERGEGQEHMQVPNVERAGARAGAGSGEEQKHTRVPNRFVAAETRCRVQKLRGGAPTIYMVGVRAKIRGHTRDCRSGLTPGAHTTRLPRCNLNPSVTGHHSRVCPAPQPEPRGHQVSLGSGP